MRLQLFEEIGQPGVDDGFRHPEPQHAGGFRKRLGNQLKPLGHLEHALR